METKSSGFSLIELLVVVAILGIIAAIGTVAYSGYVSSAKKKSAQNIMLQISLGQVEYHSDFGDYYGDSASTCTPDGPSSDKIEKDGFFVGKHLISKEKERNCPVCNVYSFDIRDDLYMNKFECCFKCYVQWVEYREERWKKGWRPNK